MHYLAATLTAALASTVAFASDQAPTTDTETLTLLGIGLVGLSIVLRKNR